jgi:hypothetical protein
LLFKNVYIHIIDAKIGFGAAEFDYRWRIGGVKVHVSFNEGGPKAIQQYKRRVGHMKWTGSEEDEMMTDREEPEEGAT